MKLSGAYTGRPQCLEGPRTRSESEEVETSLKASSAYQHLTASQDLYQIPKTQLTHFSFLSKQHLLVETLTCSQMKELSYTKKYIFNPENCSMFDLASSD